MTKEAFENLAAEEQSLIVEVPALEEKIVALKAELESLWHAYETPEFDLGLSVASVERLEKHVQLLSESRDLLKSSIARYKSVKSVEDAFNAFTKSIIGWFKKASTLIELNLYEEAKVALRKAKAEIEVADFGFDARTIALAKEMLVHRQAHLYACIADANLACDEKALPSDELEEYCAIAANMTTNFVNPADKPYHLSKSLALRLHDLAHTSKPLDPDRDMLDSLIELYEDYLTKTDFATDEVKKYAESVRQETIRHFNGLAADIISSRDKNRAAMLLDRKRPWFESAIANSTFRDSLIPEDIAKNMLLEANPNMDAAEFRITTDALAVSPNDDDSVAMLSALLSYEDLEETKFNLLLESVKNWSLGQKIHLFASAIREGVPSPRIPPLYTLIFDARPRRIDLEKRAEDILLLKEKAPAESKQRYDALIDGVLHNPGAKRIATKSKSDAIHALYPRKKFKEPIGKPTKTNEARFWSPGQRALYVLLLEVVPAMILAGWMAIAFLAPLSPDAMVDSIGAVACVALILITMIIAVTKRFGRDERASEFVRRLATILSIFPSAFAIVALTVLKDTPNIAYWSYASAGAAWLILLLPTMAFRERKNAWKFGVFFFAVAAGLAAIAFIVIHLIQMG